MSRGAVNRVLFHIDKRLLVIIGPNGLEAKSRQARGIDVPVPIYGVTKPVTSGTKPVT